MGIKQCALATAQPTSPVNDLPSWYNALHCPTGLCRPHPVEDSMPLDERKMPCRISTDLQSTLEIGGRGQ